MTHHTTHCIKSLVLAALCSTASIAAPPDLRDPGVIAAVKADTNNPPTYGALYRDTYNLGATGLRGWIWVDRSNKGDTGLITDLSRQILVTHVDAPASAVLAVDDVILGAIAASSGTVPDFTSDCRKAFAHAITDAEKAGAGTLRVKRWRAGIVSEQNITLPTLGTYSTTAPFSCPKSALILDNVRNKMVADLLANPNYLTDGFGGASNAIALLAGVKDGDPNYNEVQIRLQTFARAQAAKGAVNNGLPIWDWSYMLIFLSEYYLLTNDAQVVPGILDYTLTLAESQSIYGTYGHGPSAFRTDGSGRRVSTGYGPVNAVGGTAMIALALGKKALIAAGQAVAPEIDAAINRSAGFFAFYVNKGSVPYGEHEPYANNHASNGKDAMPAVFFSLLPNRAVETEYFARLSIAGWIGREYGHTGQGLSYYWTTLGALMGGPDAASEHLKQVRWHLDLSRRTDGSFAYDGQEQYGPGTTADDTYLGAADYGGMTASAMYLLTYSMPLQRLYITGKNANPAYTLDSTQIANSIAAGSFPLDKAGKTIPQLFAALGDYHPVVRNHAASELATRTLSGTDLTNLRNFLTNPDSNLRGSACHTLGLLQDATALPTIVTLLNDTDIWVRAKAANAIRAYPPATASAHRDAMMTSFIDNATDPDVIDWSDPIQTGNGKLSLALFGNGVPDGTPGNNIADYTINAPTQSLLYPALRAGLKQPDSYPRTGVTQFNRERLSLADTQAIYPDVAHVAAYDTPADRMWSNDCRGQAITLLANLKIADGIALALSMLSVPYDFEWGSEVSKIAALNGLASYGDAARYTLPTLKGYLNQWNPSRAEYPVLVSTIETIENATTAPAQPPGLCVANSQVVTTTGTTAITLTGSSPRGSFTYLNVTQPAHGTITGTAPNLTYTPTGGYTGPDHFTFQTTDTLTTSTVATVGIIVGPSGNGLQGEYFNNANFTSPVLTRVDPQVNFDWGTGSPDASIGADTFSVRWSGVLLVPQSGNYTFSALTSDGVRLYINGQLVIDRFVDQSTRWTDSTPVYLTAGQYAEVYMEYYENTGSAVAKLKWTGPGFAGLNGHFIPQAYLFDGSGISNRTAYAFPQSLSTNQNTPLPILLNGSGGTLTYTVLTQPTNGTLGGTAPNLTYTPHTNFSGTDSFTFLVHNGTANSLPATVTISVQAGTLTSFTWTNAVSGNWSDGTKWTPSLPAATGQPYYALNFTTAGTYTATHNLNNGFQLNQLNAAANVTLSGTQNIAFAANGGALPQLNQNGADEVTVSHPVSLQAMTTLGGSGSGTVILSGLISGTRGIVKTSPASLRIAQNNSYSGGTTIHSGTLVMETQKDSALGTGPITLHGGTLQALRINTSNPIIAHGGRIWGDGGWGGSWNGPVTLNGNLTVFVHSYDRIFLNGNISGTGGLIAEGDTSTYNTSNGVILAGTNSYTGKTIVTEGMWLHCSNPAALGSGAVEISSGAKLRLNFTGNKTVASLTLDGATMPPGTYGSTTSPATNKNDIHFSGNGTLTILPTTSTSLNLTSGTTPANPGASLTFTATVTGNTPTGNVQFYSGTTLLGSSALNGSFQATFTTTQLAIGSHNINARYVGNASNSPSTSPPVVVQINNATAAAPTSLNASPADPSINLNWTASAGASTYYVQRSTTNGGPYTVIAMVSGTTYQDSAILNGVPYYYVVSALNTAGESPNSNQANAYIGSLTATTTTLASTPMATGVYGTSVTFTSTVTSSSGTPTGTVTFRSGTNVIGTGTLSSGVATLALSTLPATTHSITASYEGSHDPSTSSPLSYQVTQKSLTLTGVTSANKVYDGTNTATLSGGTLSGIVGGDTVTIIPGVGTFASANTGTWAVTAASYSLGGTHAANYTISAQPTVPNATITARPIHITGTKTYDATTAAPNNILTIANNVDGANLSLVGNAELSAKDAGTRTLIAGNSTITRVQTTTAATTANSSNTTSITATLASAPTNGNTLIAVISTRNTTTNQVSGITGGGVTWSRVSQAANTGGSTTEIWYGPNISSGGTSITISHAGNRSSAVVMEYSGLLVPASFDVAANNTNTGTAATTGSTSSTSQASELWIGCIGAANGSPSINSLLNSFTNAGEAASTGGSAGSNTKVFSLERIATTTGTASTGGTLSASLAWSGAIATFKGGSALSLTGPAAANYTLTGMTNSITVNPKPLSVTGLSASDKTYDGTTAASLSGTPALLASQSPGAGTTDDGKPYTGDELTFSGTPTGGSFADKHVGTNKPVTGVTGLTLSGAQSGNYTLVPLGSLTAHITALPVTVAAVNDTKTYDGTTTSSGTPTITPALASGDTTTVLSQSYQSKHAGTSNKTLVPSITINDGNGGNNYAVSFTNVTTGTIHPLAITVTAVNATKTYDGTTTAPGTPTITPALAPGDTTSALSQSFDTATAGINNKLIIPSIAINDGNSGNNYNLNPVNFTTGTIQKATATVTLGSLFHFHDGSQKSATVTTNPAGLSHVITYNGSATAPTNGGIYAVEATITNANYAGSANDNLVIAYSVTYNSNGSTSGTAPASQTKFHDVGLPLATNTGTLTKTGFTFDGWNTAADGTGIAYPAGATYSGNASLILYARWAPGTDGTWTPTTAGPFNWNDTANWSGGIVATGTSRTALFTPDITAAQIVNLDGSRTIGNITFTDSTSSSHDLTLSGSGILTLSRSSGPPVIDVTQSARTLTISSQISGTNGLQKNGPGTLTLSGTNDYTGGTTLNGGTLIVNSNAALGSATTPITVNASSTLTSSAAASTSVEYTRAISLADSTTLTLRNATTNTTADFSGAITGSAGITISSASTSTIALSNTGNSFGGDLVLLPAGSTNQFVSFSSIGDGGVFSMGRGSWRRVVQYSGSANLTLHTRRIDLNADFGGIYDGGNNPINHFENNGTGTITLNAGMTVANNRTGTFFFGGTNPGDNTYAGVIPNSTGGTLSIGKFGSGKWILTNDNSFTGNVMAAGGTLSVVKIADSSVAQPLGLGGILQIGDRTNSGNFEYTGSSNVSTNKQVQLGGTTNTHTGAGGILNNGTGTLTFNNATFNTPHATATVTRTLTLGGSNTGNNTISGTIQNNNTGGNGLLALTKSDAGTWVLNGDNTYTGTTSITAGKLLINGNQTNATGNVSVSPNATLGGTGTLGGNTTVSANGRLEFHLSTISNNHDKLELAATRTLTFSGASTLTITSTGGAEPGLYTLITAPGGITGNTPSTLNLPAGWSATVSKVGNDLVLDVTATTPNYTVTYLPNNATSGTAPSNQTKIHNVTLPLAYNTGTLARTGYTFAGWNTQANGSGTSYAEGEDYTANAALTLYAKWTALPYTSWTGTNGLTGNDALSTADPDGDSLTNLQEFAFGLNPTFPSLSPLTYAPGGTANPGLPILENTGTTESPTYRAVFARRKDYQTAGLTYTVEFSANLTYWTSSATGLSVVSGTSPTAVEAVVVPFPPTVPLTVEETESASPKFFRVAVTGN